MIQIVLTTEELKRCHDFLEARNEVNAIAGTDKGTWQCAADDPQAQFQRQWESVWGELAFAKVAGLPMDWEIGVRKGSYDFLIKPGGRPMTIDVKTTRPKEQGDVLTITYRKREPARRCDAYVLVIARRLGVLDLVGWCTASEAFSEDHRKPPKFAGKDPYFEIPAAELRGIAELLAYIEPAPAEEGA